MADNWNKTPTLMTYSYNRYTSEEIAKAIKEKEWSRLDFNKGMKSRLEKEGKDVNKPYPEATPIWFMITDGEYKYIRYCYPDRIEELYDVEKDPNELVNLALQSEHEARLLAMREELVKQIKNKGGEDFADIMPVPKTQ